MRGLRRTACADVWAPCPRPCGAHLLHRLSASCAQPALSSDADLASSHQLRLQPPQQGQGTAHVLSDCHPTVHGVWRQPADGRQRVSRGVLFGHQPWHGGHRYHTARVPWAERLRVASHLLDGPNARSRAAGHTGCDDLELGQEPCCAQAPGHHHQARRQQRRRAWRCLSPGRRGRAGVEATDILRAVPSTRVVDSLPPLPARQQSSL